MNSIALCFKAAQLRERKCVQRPACLTKQSNDPGIWRCCRSSTRWWAMSWKVLKSTKCGTALCFWCIVTMAASKYEPQRIRIKKFFAKVYQMSEGHSAKIVSCAYLDFPAWLTNQKMNLNIPTLARKRLPFDSACDESAASIPPKSASSSTTQTTRFPFLGAVTGQGFKGGCGSNFPLRGGKFTLWQGTHAIRAMMYFLERVRISQLILPPGK